MNALLLMLDLVGTFIFALSGAVAGVRHRLDLFGILVLSFADSTAGGIARDVLIGDVPPNAISDWRYIAVALLAELITLRWFPLLRASDYFDPAILGTAGATACQSAPERTGAESATRPHRLTRRRE